MSILGKDDDQDYESEGENSPFEWLPVAFGIVIILGCWKVINILVWLWHKAG